MRAPFFSIIAVLCALLLSGCSLKGDEKSSEDAPLRSIEDVQGEVNSRAASTENSSPDSADSDDEMTGETEYRQTPLDKIYVSCLRREPLAPPWTTIDEMLTSLQKHRSVRDISFRMLDDSHVAMDVSLEDSLSGQSAEFSVELTKSENVCANPNGDFYEISGGAAGGRRGSKNAILITLTQIYAAAEG